MTNPHATSPLLETPARQAYSLYSEFKHFAFKGNVVDLAVGVIVGAGFAKLVDSLVKHLLMPLISVILPSQQDYLSWKWVVQGKEIPFGLFLGELLNFLLVALALFIFIVKFLGWLVRTKQQQEVTAAPPLTKDQQLLTEIRDLLRTRS